MIIKDRGVYYNTLEEALKYNTVWRGDCQLWSGASGGGYGMIRIGADEKLVGVHRFVWETFCGAIPEGLLVDHICHRRRCCNVAHLRLANTQQNAWNMGGVRAASGVRNVHKHGDLWRVVINFKGKRHIFGVFHTVEEASVVAEKQRRLLFGEFAPVGVGQN